MLHLQAKNCTTSRTQCKAILLLLLIDFVFIVTLLIFSHIKTIISFLFCSFKTKKLIIHLLDDFHIVNVFVHPSKKASSTIHMASSLHDIQQPDCCCSATSIKCHGNTQHHFHWRKWKGHSSSGRDHKGFRLG